jgi:tryptophan synthase alpha chain
MNRIDQTFAALKNRNEKALVGFVTAGDPDRKRSLEIVKAMCRNGMDVLELGVPFSDPTADGPVIQRSSARAIKESMSLSGVLEMIGEIRKESQIPIVIFSYYNPILAYGVQRFCVDAPAVGADGILVVDLPPEESQELTGYFDHDSFALIRLVAPTTPAARMKKIAEDATGFLYLVSMTGVTGTAGLNTVEISQVAGRLRECCHGTPVCVGFGISTPEQVKAVASVAEGVVVGSAFEQLIENNISNPNLPLMIGDFVSSLKKATV